MKKLISEITQKYSYLKDVFILDLLPSELGSQNGFVNYIAEMLFLFDVTTIIYDFLVTFLQVFQGMGYCRAIAYVFTFINDFQS